MATPEKTEAKENQVILEMPSKASRESRETKERLGRLEKRVLLDKTVIPSKDSLVPLDYLEYLV